jgi:acetylglutamate/LysW-gamma-L-alpha-aminoadipate kinase
MISVLKLGGGEGVNHTRVLENLVRRIQAGEAWVLVHGTSAAANALATELGYEVQMITSPNGHVSRYTDVTMIDIYANAAAGVNRSLTAQLQAYGIQAYGIENASVVRGERKKAIRAIRHGRPVIIRDDYSGKITEIDTVVLQVLLNEGYTPIIAPIALGDEGENLNVDGDLASAAVANALGANRLIILSNVAGLLRDVHHPHSLISHFYAHEIEHYEGYAQGRMKKKMLAAQFAETERVILADSRIENPLDVALAGGGTHILREVNRVERSA